MNPTDTKPWAVVLTGPPGAGKTTTGRHLARHLGAALLDLDSLTNPMVDLIGSMLGADDYADPRMAELTRGPRYEALLLVATDCLAARTPVVLIAPFTSERKHPEAWQRLADRLATGGGEPYLVWLQADPDLLVQRLTTRGAARDAGKLAAHARGQLDLDTEEPTVEALKVDASLDPDVQSQLIITSLQSGTAPH